jgi:hypothetical protein
MTIDRTPIDGSDARTETMGGLDGPLKPPARSEPPRGTWGGPRVTDSFTGSGWYTRCPWRCRSMGSSSPT